MGLCLGWGRSSLASFAVFTIKSLQGRISLSHQTKIRRPK